MSSFVTSIYGVGSDFLYLLAGDVPPHPAVDRLLAPEPGSRGAYGVGNGLQDFLRIPQQFLALAGSLSVIM